MSWKLEEATRFGQTHRKADLEAAQASVEDLKRRVRELEWERDQVTQKANTELQVWVLVLERVWM